MAKVLLIDDEPACRIPLADYLTAKKNQVTEARNGQEALELLAQSLPDVIFCDYHMPEMDGAEFVKALRTNPKYSAHSKIPIIAISEHFPVNCRQLLQGILSKPFSPRDMEAYIPKNSPAST